MIKYGILGAVLLGNCALAQTQTFGTGKDGSTWADTPRGRFECRCDKSTGNQQLLTLAGKVVFRQKPTDDIQESGVLSSGIAQQNVGCPEVVANHDGYVVLARDTQPPHYGVQGLVVVDFNVKADPPVTEIGEGPRQDNATIAKSLTWAQGGLTYRYTGFRLHEDSGNAAKIKAKPHEVFYNFAKHATVQIK